MIQSMTGYGRAIAQLEDKKVYVEIKSLNSKALDLSVRLAPLYREKEMEIRQRISSALLRGKIDLFLWIEKDSAQNAVPINSELVSAYYKQIKAISKETSIPEPTEWFPLLLRMPDVLTKVETFNLDEEEWEKVSKAIDEALSELVAFRIQEGQALAKTFSEKLDNISQLLLDIEHLETARVEKIRIRIVEGLKLIPEVEYDKNRLEQELIYYIEKLDISEEKQRLANHITYFRKTMDEGIGQGKKLGFIAQEMGREINTTGSKSNQAEMQNMVVRMKDELEQIKEQVLNVL
ncbi:MAG: YicC family protein [Prevotella sp.]|nr:YicC family protein [Prevotella sp.]